MFPIKDTSKDPCSQTALFYLIEWVCLLLFFNKSLWLPPDSFLHREQPITRERCEEQSPSPSSLTSENTYAESGKNIWYGREPCQCPLLWYPRPGIVSKACFFKGRLCQDNCLPTQRYSVIFEVIFLIPKGQFIIITLEILSRKPLSDN